MHLPLFCLLLALAWPAGAQPVRPAVVPLPPPDYARKAHTQRAAARALLIGGGLVAGAVVYATRPGNPVSLDALPLVGAVGMAGGLAVLGSVPLFAAAGRNRRKAGPVARVAFGVRAALAYTGAPAVGPALRLRIGW